MSKIKFIHYKNIQDSYGEEALVNITTNEIVFNGDYYHDKVSIAIANFLKGLEYANVDFEVEIKTISEEECKNLPYELNFYYEDEITSNTNTDFVVDYSCNGMNEKDDDEIELNRSNKQDEDDEVIIDDINAFINGAYDKNEEDRELYSKEKEVRVENNRYYIEIEDFQEDFYANSIEIALLSAWNYNGYLYIYNENGEKELIFTPFEDDEINNNFLARFGIGVKEYNSEFYWLKSGNTICINDDDYIKFF